MPFIANECVWGMFTVRNFPKCKIGLTEIEQKHYSLFICRKLFRTSNFARVVQILFETFRGSTSYEFSIYFCVFAIDIESVDVLNIVYFSIEFK